jgi:lipid-binding SYLF domain-containing protein
MRYGWGREEHSQAISCSMRSKKELSMKNNVIAVLLCLAASVPVVAQKADERLTESTAVLQTIMTKNEIPQDVWNKAVCVMVYPSVKKVGLGIGVGYGRGVLVCRSGANLSGKWGAPIMYTLDTHSLGAQLGSSATDYVLVVMTQRGADKVLSGKLKLGAGASAVAGPSGAGTAGFNDPNVDILSYAQSKGLFAGASLGSASMASDNDMNKELYGQPIDAVQMVRESHTPIPQAAQPLIDELQKVSPRRM